MDEEMHPQASEPLIKGEGEYDFVIVGAGPSGLALAHVLDKYGKRCLVLEREDVIGGLHRVKRVNGNFTEHGPRVYYRAYQTVMLILDDLHLKFDELFEPITIDFVHAGTGTETIFTKFSPREYVILAYSYFRLVLNSHYGKPVAMSDFVKYHQFSPQATDIIDRVCRLTGGGWLGNYSLNQFLLQIDKIPLYTIRALRQPTDEGLMRVWKEHLLKSKRVELRLGVAVDHLKDNHTLVLSDGKTTIDAKSAKIVFAIPPFALKAVLERSYDPMLFGPGFFPFAERKRIIPFINMSLIWNSRVDFPIQVRIPVSDWGIIFMRLFRGMETKRTVVSIAISYLDRKSIATGKTANESSEEEIKKEVVRVVREVFNWIPAPDLIVRNPNVQFDPEKKAWAESDSAYFGLGSDSIPFEAPKEPNRLYTLGTQNGQSYYPITSMETAVSNAFYLFNKLYPGNGLHYRPRPHLTISRLIRRVVLGATLGTLAFAVAHRVLS